MWIENVAAADIPAANHFDAGANSMLIQIIDPVKGWVPVPKHRFKEIHRFDFADLEDGDDGVEEFGITDLTAHQLVSLLKTAHEQRMNVVVHCTAGMCRSGAVVEIGKMMGFVETDRFRQPNMRVKSKMMAALDWSYKDIAI